MGEWTAEERLIVWCGGCGAMEHMQPSEWGEGGDAHQFAYYHGQSCKYGRMVCSKVIPTASMNDLYRARGAGRMGSWLNQNGRHPTPQDGAPRG